MTANSETGLERAARERTEALQIAQDAARAVNPNASSLEAMLARISAETCMAAQARKKLSET